MRPDPYTRESLAQAHAHTIEALQSGAEVIYQGALFDGTFGGLADFLVRGEDGRYEVWDTKLTRHAKVEALLQIAAYADLLDVAGVDRSSTGCLVLGDNKESRHDLDEIIPVYRQRRSTLELTLRDHIDEGGAVAWNDLRYEICGTCAHCQAEIASNDDLLKVANLRRTQRTKLRSAGITTMTELAASTGDIPGIAAHTLTPLRAQAALQAKQDEPDAHGSGHDPSRGLRPRPHRWVANAG